MALSNFSLPFGAIAPPTTWGITNTPTNGLHPIQQLATNTNNLLYSPADHQQQSTSNQNPDYYKNNPYSMPAQHQQQQQQQQQHNHHQQQQQQQQQPPSLGQNVGYSYSGQNRRRSGNTYLPPPSTTTIENPPTRNSIYHHQQQQQQQQQQQLLGNENSLNYPSNTREPGEGSYTRYPQVAPPPKQQQQQHLQQSQFFSAHGSASFTKNSGSFSISSFNSRQPAAQPPTTNTPLPPEQPQLPAATYGVAGGGGENYPERQPGFTRVQAGQGSRTQVHAILDYDVEEGEEDDEDEEDDNNDENDGGEYFDGDTHRKGNARGGGNNMPTVTPIQGPIFLKNGSVPVVPLFSYPKLNNGTFLQIPIWWTALSVALGLDVRGDVIKGVPCIKRYHQLFCPTAGNSYPIDKIERFIDDNKALMRRMYGDFEMNMEPGGAGPGGANAGRSQGQAKVRKRRFIDEPDIFIPPGAYAAQAGEAGDSYFGNLRKKRQAAGANGGTSQSQQRNKVGSSNTPPGNKATNNNNANGSGTGRLDACESKIEIVTPYWASNSAGKIRAIVNTQHFEQAIHQEVCSTTQTSRCEGECGCEQKYKWHRLLAYDPDNDCKGIFMDWFLFPSCCVCRCNP